MNRKSTASIILFFVFGSVFSQHKLGVFMDGGVSKMKSELATTNPTISSVYSNSIIITGSSLTKYQPTGRVGLSYNYDFDKFSNFGVNVFYTMMKCDENINGTRDQIRFDITKHNTIYYIGLPIYYGFRLKKFTIQNGVQFLFVAYATGYQSEITHQNPFTITWNAELQTIKTQKIDFGLSWNLNYQIHRRFDIYASYYRGLTNIIKDDIHKKYKNNQLTFGVKFNFIAPKPKEESKSETNPIIPEW